MLLNIVFMSVKLQTETLEIWEEYELVRYGQSKGKFEGVMNT